MKHETEDEQMKRAMAEVQQEGQADEIVLTGAISGGSSTGGSGFGGSGGGGVGGGDIALDDDVPASREYPASQTSNLDSANNRRQRKKLEAAKKKKQGVMDALATSQRAADAADPSSWKDHLQGGATQGCICRRAGEECRDPNCAWRTEAVTAQPAADVIDLCDSDDSDNAGVPKTDNSALIRATRTDDEGEGVGGAKEASSVRRKVKDMVAGAAVQVATAAAAVAQLITAPKKRREQKRWSREEGAAAGSTDRQPQEKKQRISKQVALTVGATFPALSLTSKPLSIVTSNSSWGGGSGWGAAGEESAASVLAGRGRRPALQDGTGGERAANRAKVHSDDDGAGAGLRTGAGTGADERAKLAQAAELRLEQAGRRAAEGSLAAAELRLAEVERRAAALAEQVAAGRPAVIDVEALGGAGMGAGTGARGSGSGSSGSSGSSSGSGLAQLQASHQALTQVKREKATAEAAAEDRAQCVVCMESDRAVLFLPCGHAVACAACAVGLQQCPLCRCEVERAVPFFL
jgi:hypothetical protein